MLEHCLTQELFKLMVELVEPPPLQPRRLAVLAAMVVLVLFKGQLE
jgi:hypothetical protein